MTIHGQPGDWHETALAPAQKVGAARSARYKAESWCQPPC